MPSMRVGKGESLPPKGDPALKGLTEEEFNKIFSEVGEPRDVKVLYYVLPLRRRTSAQVLATVQNMVLRLKSQGLPLQRVHSDRARELRTEPLKRWLLQHGALSTYTEGQRPQQNGRAEAAVKQLKNDVRLLLASTGLPRTCWSTAGVYAAAAQRSRVLGMDAPPLPYGAKIHLRSKTYGKNQNPGSWDLRWRSGFYMGPSLDVQGGHVVRFEDGTYTTTRHVRSGLIDSDKLVDLGQYEAVIPVPAKRYRRKTTIEDEPEDPEEEVVGPYDPNHPAEHYAIGLLDEDVLTPDQLETLVHLLPTTSPVPRRFGEQDQEKKLWTVGAFVHGGVVGVKKATTTFPMSTRVFTKYINQIAPGFQFNALAVNVDILTQ